MNPTDKNEIINIINILNLNKSTGPHNIPSSKHNNIKYCRAFIRNSKLVFCKWDIHRELKTVKNHSNFQRKR